MLIVFDKQMHKIMNCKVLIINALRKEKHISHFTLDEAIKVSEQVKAKSVYLTHVSHLLGKHDATSTILPKHIKIAYDGLTLSF